jgi:hypothetical protein
MFSSTVNYLLAKKGQIVSFHTVREMKVRKGQDPIQKESWFLARVGVSYDNIQNVKDKREDGRLPEENAGLPWGQWLEYPHVIGHKGEEYVRCSTLKNSNTKGRVKYLRNGAEISREEAQLACLASEFRERDDDSDVFNIKASSILEVK